MEFYYLIIVGILFILAISDLMVGVANDAVNFLNSAIGSKAASMRTVMIIASVGVLLGATFSSGMMEVARNGIFRPEMFYFNEIMMIFLAVMICDVLLLDIFNTYGLPTSTTVSLVFGLLGASVGIAIMKISNAAEYTLLDLGTFINSNKAMAIIFSILASVIIGFIFGALIQYLARLLFTFKLRRSLAYYGSIWGGICFTMIIYFIVFKGAKDSSLISPAVRQYITDHVMTIMLATFAATTVILQAIYWIFRVNVLKFVVLAGTFALAMAFAGNDLVNFIGVPMAGLSSFQIWQSSAAAPEALSMEGLRGAVPTQELILFGAGMIMLLTLWFSKKAKSVIKTTVDLSRQDQGTERFSSTPLSRSIVKLFVGMNEFFVRIMPKSMLRWIDKRFKPYKKTNPDAAFDLVRASVNLLVASSLIAFGTSLKLPLSTTYITFMVAMGSSLSDGAWGRETAVYRITGVFTVVGGWFVTAIAAFSISLLAGFLLYAGGYVAVAGLIILIVFSMIRTRAIHKKRESDQNIGKRSVAITAENVSNIQQIAAETLSENLAAIDQIYSQTVSGLASENIRQLHSTRDHILNISQETKAIKDQTGQTIRIFSENQIENVFYYIQSINYLHEIAHAQLAIAETSFAHTNNKHRPLISEQLDELAQLSMRIHTLYEDAQDMIRKAEFDNLETFIVHQQELSQHIDGLNKNQLKRVKIGLCGTKNSLLYASILSNSKNLLMFTTLLLKSDRRFNMESN